MVQTGNLKEIAYEHLRDMIANDEFEDGVIYSERKISSEIGVSRTPFHSALQQLEQDGYVDILPSRGFVLHEMNVDDIRETFEVRSAIEFFCISCLAQDYRQSVPKSVDTIESLKKRLSKQEEIFNTTGDIKQFVKYDFAFHTDIVAYPENRTFNDIFRSFTYRINRLARESLAHEGRMKNTVEEHRAILDGIIHYDFENLYPITMRHFNNPRYINLADLREKHTIS